MRTTVTLDDDVVKTIKDEMKEGDGKTFKEVVNELIRYARISKLSMRNEVKRKPFKVKAKDLGLYPHLNYDKVAELLDRIEGPFHK